MQNRLSFAIAFFACACHAHLALAAHCLGPGGEHALHCFAQCISALIAWGMYTHLLTQERGLARIRFLLTGNAFLHSHGCK